MGASITGSLVALPKKFPEGSMWLTSLSTRGRNAISSIACRLRSAVVSVSAPPMR
jgi:hypothetical protein